MTASAQPHPDLLGASDAIAAPARVRALSKDETRSAWRIWIGVVIACLGLYLLTYNVYWVPGGDSELYVSLARSLAQGKGYVFNGSHVSISPPGWPLLLAGVMKVWPTFAAMKLVALCCMVGSLALWYWILLRLTTPKWSAAITLMTAILSHVYSLSFWLHSDALFCFVACAAMLVAFQINERQDYFGWRLAALLVLCALMVFVRWAGVLQWLIVAAILVHNQPIAPLLWLRKQANALPSKRLMLATFLSGVVTFGVFVAVRQAVKLTSEEAELAKDQGAVLDDSTQVAPAESRTVDLINTTKQPKNMPREYARRFFDSGKWFSWLVWQPLRFIGGVKLASIGGTLLAIGLVLAILYAIFGGNTRHLLISTGIFAAFLIAIFVAGRIGLVDIHPFPYPLSLDVVVGWMMIITIAVVAVREARNHRWLLVAAMIYSAGLCLNWPNPNSRYLVPIAPLLIWGTIHFLQTFRPNTPRVWPWAQPLLRTTFIATLILANGALFGIDAWIARSHDFYARYEAGLDKNLINICNYLRKQGLDDRDVAVNERYTNMGRQRWSKFGVRATVMLSDVVTKYVPNKYAGDPTSQKSFYNWARRYKVKYYLVQQPTSPWRVWHFRLTASLQQSLTHEPVEYVSGGWQLYKIIDKGPPTPTNAPYAQLINVPEVKNWPRRVPGL
jgi:hypothetical protein